MAAPLNPADINQIQGTYASLPPLTTDLGTALPSAVPGNEACFEVLATGSSTAPIERGDWVIARHTGLGTWRTHLQVPASAVLRIPSKDNLTPTQAATASINPVTAWRLLKNFVALDAGKGDWYIQNGANSGVGRAALQLGRRWGYKSIAIVRARPGTEGEALAAELGELGATHVVSEAEALARDFPERVQAWTAGGRERVRLGLNCVGGKPAVAMAKVLSRGGHVVTYGAMSRQAMAVPAGMLIFKDVVFEGFWVSRWAEREPQEKERTVGRVLEMIRRGQLRDVPMVEVPWAWGTQEGELVDAVQETLKGYRKGKGVLVFEDT